MPFVSFLRANWRWLAYPLAVLLAGLLLTQATEYATAWLARRHLRQQVEATDAARAARLATENARRSSFDSAVWGLAERHREMLRQAQLTKKQDESLAHLLPAAPVLPARPPRY